IKAAKTTEKEISDLKASILAAVKKAKDECHILTSSPKTEGHTNDKERAGETASANEIKAAKEAITSFEGANLPKKLETLHAFLNGAFETRLKEAKEAYVRAHKAASEKS